jgi:aspartyl-tRNA synthetase
VKDRAFQGGIAKFITDSYESFDQTLDGLKEMDLILFVADEYQTCCRALAHVRLELGNKLKLIDQNAYNFLWVNEFPLFEWDKDRSAFNPMHHLFTMPLQDDLKNLDSDPGSVRGQLYDLVLNGVELISGSIRINRHEIQQKVLDIVKMPKDEALSKFGFLMEAFKFGAPPHGGSALGLDRLCAILCGTDSIREVMAYPCNNQGVFPLDSAPAALDDWQLNELNLSLRGGSDA